MDIGFATFTTLNVSGTINVTQGDNATLITGNTPVRLGFNLAQGNNTSGFAYKYIDNLVLAASQSDAMCSFTALFGISQPKGTMDQTSIISGLWGGRAHGSFLGRMPLYQVATTQADNTASLSVVGKDGFILGALQQDQFGSGSGPKGTMAAHEIVSGLWGGQLHASFADKNPNYTFFITSTQDDNTSGFVLTGLNLFQIGGIQDDNAASFSASRQVDVNSALGAVAANATSEFVMFSDAIPSVGDQGGDDGHDYIKKLKQQFRQKQQRTIMRTIQKFLETVE